MPSFHFVFGSGRSAMPSGATETDIAEVQKSTPPRKKKKEKKPITKAVSQRREKLACAARFIAC